jgi:hypothetical protein
MRVLRNVIRLNVNNLGPPSIGETPSKFLVDFNTNTMNRYRKKI